MESGKGGRCVSDELGLVLRECYFGSCDEFHLGEYGRQQVAKSRGSHHGVRISVGGPLARKTSPIY